MMLVLHILVLQATAVRIVTVKNDRAHENSRSGLNQNISVVIKGQIVIKH